MLRGERRFGAALAFALLAACGGNGSSSGATSGRLSLRALWQRAAQGNAVPQFSSELPPSVQRVQIVFEAAPGSNGTLRCCVKVNPISVQQDGDHLVVVNNLTLGPAIITLFGFPTTVAPAPDGITATCSTNPTSVGEPCDPQPAPDQPPSSATYQSNPQSIVVSATQTDTPLIELFAVNPIPTATATATSGLTDTPTETPTQTSTTQIPTETPTPLTSGTPTPTLTQGQTGTATSTSTETPTATSTSMPAPIDISGQWNTFEFVGGFGFGFSFSCSVTIVQTGGSYTLSGPCESGGQPANSITLDGTIDTVTGDFAGTGTLPGGCNSLSVSGTATSDGNSLSGTYQCDTASRGNSFSGTRSAVFTPTATGTATPTFTQQISPLPPTPTPQPTPSGPAVVAQAVAALPGQTVPVSFSLFTDSAAVAGTQNDVNFDPANAPIAAKANGTPDCTVNPAINKSATSFAYRPTGCVGADCTAIRALVSATDNVALIADGSVLYTCNVNVAAPAPAGTYSLILTGVSMEEPNGAAVPGVVGIDGSVYVALPVQPTPTFTQMVSPATPTSTLPPTDTQTPTATPTPTDTPTPTLTATPTAVSVFTAVVAQAASAGSTTLVLQGVPPGFPASGTVIQIGPTPVNVGYTLSGNTLTLSSPLPSDVAQGTAVTASLCATNPVAGGSIVVFENLQVNAGSDPILSLENTASNPVNVYCFYADSSQPACRTFGFNAQLGATSSLQWQASVGGPVPGTGIPFSGELVCVELDVGGFPLPLNFLAGTSQIAGQCAAAATSIGGFNTNNFDSVLCLGNSSGPSCLNGAEYDNCPAGVDPARIQECWSQSQFTFVCALPAGATPTPTPTPTTTPVNPPPATRTVAPAPNGAASMLVYPYVTVDSANGVDTVVQIANTSISPVMLHCFYEDTTAHCSNQATTACTAAASCPVGGTCVPSWSVTDFTIGLTGMQPTSWRVSQGLGASSIPAAAEDPFVGLLRCLVVDSAGVAVGNNALDGEATIERFVPGARLDVAKYNAAAIQALTTGNGDNTLILEDSSFAEAEYQPCPATLVLNNFFDGASDPILPGTVTTTLAIVPCSVDYATPQPSTVTVKYTIFNEFEQSFSASHGALAAQTVSSLADIARIFNFSVAGTLTGQARIVGVEGGVLGVALEAHQSGAASQSAGLNLNVQGRRFAPDTAVLPPAQ